MADRRRASTPHVAIDLASSASEIRSCPSKPTRSLAAAPEGPRGRGGPPRRRPRSRGLAAPHGRRHTNTPPPRGPLPPRAHAPPRVRGLRVGVEVQLHPQPLSTRRRRASRWGGRPRRPARGGRASAQLGEGGRAPARAHPG
eukprot:5756039-Pyramimonas_sp.AAC.1